MFDLINIVASVAVNMDRCGLPTYLTVGDEVTIQVKRINESDGRYFAIYSVSYNGLGVYA